MPQDSKSAVIMFSGGLDSTTLLYYYLKNGFDCYPLIFRYGQKHSKEINHASEICKNLKLQSIIAEIKGLSGILESSLTQKDREITDAQSTVVPFRNGIFLSMAAAYAKSLGVNRIAYGANKNDYEIYADCRENFILSMQKTINLALRNNRFIIDAPFLEKSKAEIVKLATKIGVNLQKTWSCYKGAIIHCGKCPSCLERRSAFKQAKLSDPTVYAS